MMGLMIAAPHSGAGKTTVTLGLLRALRRSGVTVGSAKAGPDYIDPAFHAAASGGPCVNLDPWAMRPALIASLADEARQQGEAFVVEAMMGLFDGAADGSGSAADLAAMLDLKIVLVVDCAKQSHSVAALVRGFATHRADLAIAGLVLNRVGSDRHESLLREALVPLAIPVLGVLPRQPDLALPERHLGLVQAGEHGDLDAFVERAADWITQGCDLFALAALAGTGPEAAVAAPRALAAPLAPLGQTIAVARDEAFAFAYPHLLAGWREAGAALSFFSPLADEAPDPAADAIYLPGGYPELHAGRLAAASVFLAGTRAAAERGVAIYGECGGYMVLGETLTDADGTPHPMLGLLPLETSFARRKLHLGYRRLEPVDGAPWAGPLRAHEFHYASIVAEGPGEALFRATDARGLDLGRHGLRRGRVSGSFLHVIDRES
ncbi:cobyrinate a,c-diamide synthase [Aurantimonas sp. C2-6-R+9]|uniref:cobyrinate a,c-diamide synthase n=1 Tax=unclassified Aurantimonas TaxID=2638230 RepID=UPI002E189EB4|nr:MULTISPECIES: cobyrinate a,c-diamide synthase [unclassified Aurantimonas]MEC5289798.1 cobyrinate a,c-diamide synthase [Aurantimonas sp. C2-3-R2]MEC5379765.1 cobyrinate a,c-diamide synthase [Aurantimonas sp. C2-6-R+9]MEC5410763.1 cobyrinate a,c-diamide synthase [Aurantimonas sp. C2-4-R8]